MPISVGGIVSGIDTDAMTATLLEAARAPQQLMEADLEEKEDLKSTYESLIEKMTALQEAIEALDSPSELRATSTTSDDDTTVGVEAEGDAVAGRYEITVTALASVETEVSEAFADKSSTGVIAEGTLSITYGGTTTALTIDSTNSSLEDLADLINESVSGVSAYVMDTGDATTPYRLVISGDDTGADNSITVDTSGLTGTGTVPTFTETSTAGDAALTVNGISVTSADNDVGGVVAGITFNLKDVTTSAVTVTVETDVDTTVANITTFVDAWNDTQAYIRAHRAFNEDEDIKGEFVGEGTVVNLMQSMRRLVATDYGIGDYSALSTIGISTKQNGDLEIDTDALEEALEAAPDDVAALFDADESGFGTALTELMEAYTEEDTGYLALRDDAIDEEIETLEEDIEDFDERMDAYEERLKKQFTAMEIALGKLEDAQAQLAALLPDTSTSSS